jgi:RND family efflux transporter MFP subunit
MPDATQRPISRLAQPVAADAGAARGRVPVHALAWLGLAWLSLGLLAPHAHAADVVAATQVPTVKLQAGVQGPSLVWEGQLQALRQSTVAAQVNGNILALLVKAGDSVKAGQVLARVDDRAELAGLARSEADVAQAEAQLHQARLQWERSQALKAQGFISTAALDSAQAQWLAAKAGVEAARAGKTQAVLNKGYATVSAPFDGRVLATHAEVGDLAAPGRPILTLYAPQAMRAVVQVPRSQADAARQATDISVGLPPSQQGAWQWLKPIKVTALPGADPVSQTVEWRLDLPDVAALPGQAVTVRFAGLPATSSAEPGLMAPADALVRRGELTGVYVVREGRFVLQAVRTAPVRPGALDVRLLSGVKAGDVIAADGTRAGLAGATPSTKATTPATTPAASVR